MWLAIMLAGSDIPPPRGFVWVVAGLVVICCGMALAIPWLWEVGQRSGLWAVLVRTAGIGLVVGLALAAAFAPYALAAYGWLLRGWMRASCSLGCGGTPLDGRDHEVTDATAGLHARRGAARRVAGPHNPSPRAWIFGRRCCSRPGRRSSAPP